MAFRKTVPLSAAGEEALKRIMHRRGVKESGAVEVAIDWMYRCDQIAGPDGRITKIILAGRNGQSKEVTVL